MTRTRFALRNKSIAAAVLLLLTFTLSLHAAAPAAPAPGSPTKRMFWKITSPTTTVYFFGSIHLASSDMYPLPPEIDAAYKDSAMLVVEADITKVNQEALAMQVMLQGMYPQGDSLDKHLTPETKKALDEYLAAKGLPAALIAPMKPPLAALTLQALILQDSGLSENGIDMYFLTQANTAKDKKIVELETADMQVKLLMGMDDALADRFLRESLKEGSKAELDKLVKAWKEGDDKTMETAMSGEEKTDADAKKLNELMIYKRNDDMVKKIDDMLKGKDKAMVVVGAAHFVGERGILKQLETKGYKVERPALTTPARSPATNRP
jgi:uncharacterized protein YbaP (TraB family)